MADVEQNLQAKIEFAKGLHKTATEWMREWEQLYKGEFATPRDQANADVNAYKPARPRAIVAKMLALLSLRAKMQNQVVPKKDTQEEEAICTNLERYLQGYQWRIQTEKNQPVFRHAVQWGLLRGKAVLLARYVPGFVDSEFFPIRTEVPDPATVFEVPGENGIMYFVRESERYALELSRELDRRVQTPDGGPPATGGEAEKPSWTIPGKLLDKQPTDKCKVTEYWDGEYYAVLIDGEMVLPPTEHEYGFCPIAVAYFEDTPFHEMEWKGQGVLAPIADAIKNEAMLMARLGDAASTFFYPLVFWQSTDGRGGWINPYAASVSSLPVDAKITIYAPQPNLPILESFRHWLNNDVNLMTLPEIAWGLNPTMSGQSGFAISQVLGQVMDRIEDKKEYLQFAFGTHFGHVLRLTAAFADRAEGGRFQVMTTDGGPRSALGGRGRRLLAIGADQVAEHYQVMTHITPTLPTEKMAMIQQMAALRQPSRLTGLPLVDDKSLRGLYPEVFENMDEINLRVDEEYWRKKLPEVEQWEQDEYMQEWRKTHKPHETNAVDLAKLPKEQLVQMMKMLETMMQHPQAFQQMLAPMGPPASYGVGQGDKETRGQGVGATEPGAMLPSSILPPQMQGMQFANPIEEQAGQIQDAMMPPR